MNMFERSIINENPKDRLVSDFHNFIKGEVGRPGRVETYGLNTEEAINTVTQSFLEYNFEDITSVANGLSFLYGINQGIVSSYIKNTSSEIFVKLRNLIINYLCSLEIENQNKLKNYIWVYELLGIERSFVVKYYQKIRYGVENEDQYLMKLEPKRVQRYVISRLKK